jgi:hypothetical protein
MVNIGSIPGRGSQAVSTKCPSSALRTLVPILIPSTYRLIVSPNFRPILVWSSAARALGEPARQACRKQQVLHPRLLQSDGLGRRLLFFFDDIKKLGTIFVGIVPKEDGLYIAGFSWEGGKKLRNKKRLDLI